MSGGARLVRGALRAALTAGRACGVAPLRLTRAAVSPARARYCCFVTGVCTGMVLVGRVYSVARQLRTDSAAIARSPLWYLLTLSEPLLTALIVSAHGFGGARRMARLLDYLRQIEMVHVTNDIAPAAEAGRALLAWAVVVWAVLIALFSHCFYSTLVVISNGDMSSLLLFVFLYAQGAVKAVITLEYAGLMSALSSATSALLASFRELRLTDDDDDSYKKAVGSVRNIKRSYLALQRVVQRVNAQEGSAVLLLLAASIYKMIHNIFVATSAYYSHVSDGLVPVTLVIIILSLVWIVFELVKTVALIEPCHAAAAATRRWRAALGARLAAARRGELRGELRDELASFHEFFDVSSAAFSPLDICPVSRSLLAAIVGGCSTFLVVMLQFNLKDAGEHV